MLLFYANKEKTKRIFPSRRTTCRGGKRRERSAGKLTRYVNAVELGVGGKKKSEKKSRKKTSTVCRRHLHANESLHSQAQSSVSTFSNFSLNKFSSSFLFNMKCSSSCGTGMQIRSVECVDSHGALNTQCDPETRPNSMQECSTGISCTSESPSSTSAAMDFNDGASEINRNDANLNRNDAGDDDISEVAVEDQLDAQHGKIAKKFVMAKSKEDDEDLDDDEYDDDEEMQGDDPSPSSFSPPQPQQKRHDDTEFERQQRLRLTHLFRSRRTDRHIDPKAPNEPT